jgi:hypothetical protein
MPISQPKWVETHSHGIHILPPPPRTPSLQIWMNERVIGLLKMPQTPKLLKSWEKVDILELKQKFWEYKSSDVYKGLLKDFEDKLSPWKKVSINSELDILFWGTQELLDIFFNEDRTDNYLSRWPNDWPFYLIVAMERLEQEYPDQNAKPTLH